MLCVATLTQHVDRADWLLTVPTAMSGSRNRFPRKTLCSGYFNASTLCASRFAMLPCPRCCSFPPSPCAFCTLAATRQHLTSFASRYTVAERCAACLPTPLQPKASCIMDWLHAACRARSAGAAAAAGDETRRSPALAWVLRICGPPVRRSGRKTWCRWVP